MSPQRKAPALTYMEMMVYINHSRTWHAMARHVGIGLLGLKDEKLLVSSQRS